mgnify:CR=1 FL=1
MHRNIATSQRTGTYPKVRPRPKLMPMQPHKAVVKNGRLTLDEPTDLPDGEVVELVSVEDVIAQGGDDLDDTERAALHAELKASVADARSGELVDADALLAELRAMR